jgi:methionine-rich copper-binding protein CopC
MKRRTSRFGVIITFVITFSVALIGLTALVQAHTKLEKSEPAAGATVAAPKQIQLWFNEKIDVAVSKIELTSPSGTVELGPPHSMGGKTLMAAVTGKIAAGTYTVAWQTAGDDGHVVKGDYTFSVSSTTSH